jgi:hypothetical protein
VLPTSPDSAEALRLEKGYVGQVRLPSAKLAASSVLIPEPRLAGQKPALRLRLQTQTQYLETDGQVNLERVGRVGMADGVVSGNLATDQVLGQVPRDKASYRERQEVGEVYAPPNLNP